MMGVVRKGKFKAKAKVDGRICHCMVKWQIIGDMRADDPPADGVYEDMLSIGVVKVRFTDRKRKYYFHTHPTSKELDGHWTMRNAKQLGGDFAERLANWDDEACRQFIRFISEVDSRMKPLNLHMPGKGGFFDFFRRAIDDRILNHDDSPGFEYSPAAQIGRMDGA